jgi:hypothetical protein
MVGFDELKNQKERARKQYQNHTGPWEHITHKMATIPS